MKKQHSSFNYQSVMRNVSRHIFLSMLVAGLYGQATAQSVPDSVIRQYESAKTDNEKLRRVSIYLYKFQNDTSFLKKAGTLIDFLESKKDFRNQDYIQLSINDQLSRTGEYVTSLASAMEIANRFERRKDKAGILAAYRQLSAAYFYAGDKEKDLVYGKKAFLIAKEISGPYDLASIANNISTSYSQKNMADSALLYARMAINYAKQSTDVNVNATTGVLGTMAEAFISAKQYDSALIYARQSLVNGSSGGDLLLAWTFNDLSQIFLETNKYDSSTYYAGKAIQISAANRFKDQLQRGYEYLSRSFDKTHNSDSAFKYLQLAVAIKDSFYNSDKTKQVQNVIAREQSRLQEIEKEKIDFQNKIKLYGLITGFLILAIVAFLLYRNNRQKQKANSKLQSQKEKVETTLQELKLTQQQLIQSEKMASLGELTAGIAHEIQNPLNFVNNFSEVNAELIEEMVDEVKKGNTAEAEAIANDIKQNLEKINHHGKRADAIVKGMLQHSRTTGSTKEPTDINKLADEYLRLAYHGLRAKDNSFNATLKTDYDERIDKINVIPQDIGRVVLNLITNAFYVVSEKKKQNQNTYEPTVSVTTKSFSHPSGGRGVSITIGDNGLGIPKNILDKIFQPFFSTKPTGQGTGLGLSLAYDIVKAHGGELKVATKENEGAEFTIQLPLNHIA